MNATALSMVLTPPLFVLLDRVLLPRLTGTRPSRAQDRVESDGAPVILALDNPEKALVIVETIEKHFPHLHIMARATGRHDAYALVNRGLPHVFRETLGTALDMGYRALRHMGMRGMQAHRAVRAFEDHNEKAFRELARLSGDDKAYVSALRVKIGEAEDLLKDSRLPGQHLDLAWDNAPLREAARAGVLKR